MNKNNVKKFKGRCEAFLWFLFTRPTSFGSSKTMKLKRRKTRLSPSPYLLTIPISGCNKSNLRNYGLVVIIPWIKTQLKNSCLMSRLKSGHDRQFLKLASLRLIRTTTERYTDIFKNINTFLSVLWLGPFSSKLKGFLIQSTLRII